jgi:hypothetical protein
MWILVSSLLSACGGSSAQNAPPSASPSIDEKAERFQAQGLTVTRPTGWTFVKADQSVGKDAVIVLVGPAAEYKLGPMVAISKRAVLAADRRVDPAELLKNATMELVQSFDGDEAVVAPVETTLAGQKSVVVKAKYTELMTDGTEVGRRAQFYAAVAGDQMWFVRCTLPVGDAFDADLTAILASIAFEPL